MIAICSTIAETLYLLLICPVSRLAYGCSCIIADVARTSTMCPRCWHLPALPTPCIAVCGPRMRVMRTCSCSWEMVLLVARFRGAALGVRSAALGRWLLGSCTQRVKPARLDCLHAASTRRGSTRSSNYLDTSAAQTRMTKTSTVARAVVASCKLLIARYTQSTCEYLYTCRARKGLLQPKPCRASAGAWSASGHSWSQVSNA
jgi:hypothetical protein